MRTVGRRVLSTVTVGGSRVRASRITFKGAARGYGYDYDDDYNRRPIVSWGAGRAEVERCSSVRRSFSFRKDETCGGMVEVLPYDGNETSQDHPTPTTLMAKGFCPCIERSTRRGMGIDSDFFRNCMVSRPGMRTG